MIWAEKSVKRGELDLLLQRYEIHNIVTPFKIILWVLPQPSLLLVNL